MFTGEGKRERAPLRRDDHAWREEEEQSFQHLQDEGEPGHAQRPAEGRVHVGQLFWPEASFRLLQRLVGVADVQAHAGQCQHTFENNNKQKQDQSGDILRTWFYETFTQTQKWIIMNLFHMNSGTLNSMQDK